MAAPDEQNPAERGLVQVSVAPNNPKASLWKRFGRWVVGIARSEVAQKSRERVEEYLGVADEAGLERLRNPKYVNAEARANIEHTLAKARSERDENRRKNDRHELELRLLSAEVRKAEAEALQVENDTVQSVMRQFADRGFAVDFNVNDNVPRMVVVDVQGIVARRLADPYFAQPVIDLELSSNVVDILDGEGIETIGDLVSTSATELVAVAGLGEDEISEILDALSTRGLSLGTGLGRGKAGRGAGVGQPGTFNAGSDDEDRTEN